MVSVTALNTLQGKSTTREWDLNRPDAKRQELPARLGDDDPRCGPASLQRFAGEDLTVRRQRCCWQPGEGYRRAALQTQLDSYCLQCMPVTGRALHMGVIAPDIRTVQLALEATLCS
jgi:hypothetical protein